MLRVMRPNTYKAYMPPVTAGKCVIIVIIIVIIVVIIVITVV